MKSNFNYFVKIKFKVHKIPERNIIEFFRNPILFLSLWPINQNVNENLV